MRNALNENNNIMKITTIIIRTLMGLLLLFASIVVLFNLFPQPELTGKVKTFMDGVNATGYLMTLIKVTELLCGIAFVTGRFVPLAAVVLAPITINILLFHAFLDRTGLPVAIFLFFGNIFLGYAYRKNFASVLAAK
jgi:putative oxidoreductase